MSGKFGLHMGNSTICLSINKDAKVDVVATKYGERCSPAYVAATTTENEFMIGAPAKERYPRDFLFTVTNNFQLLNAAELSAEQLAAAKAHIVCALDEERLVYQLNNVKFEFETELTPHQVAVKLFENLYENAQQAFISDKAFEAVLAVPAHFSAASRRSVIAAATEAGFNILQVISEPTAALLAYEIGFGGADEPAQHVLVYRVGGLTADITAFRVADGLYEQLETVHLPFGGNRITDKLAEYMFPLKIKKLELEGRKLRDTKLKIYHHADDCKRILSTMQSMQVFMENLVTYDDVSYDNNQTVTRARFENTFAGELQAFTRPVEQLLAKLGVPVDKVILCGGAIKTPKLQAAVTALFASTVQILNTIQPDEVISIGCARQASFVSAATAKQLVQEQLDLEVDTLTQAIAVNGEVVLAAGSAVPAERLVEAVPLAADGGVKVSVAQTDDGAEQEVAWTAEATTEATKKAAKVDVQVRVEAASPEGKEAAAAAALQFTIKCQ